MSTSFRRVLSPLAPFLRSLFPSSFTPDFPILFLPVRPLSSFHGVPRPARCERHATITGALFLSTVVDALVIVQAVQRPEHLVAERAHRAVQGLEVLLLFVPFQGELRGEGLAADVAGIANARRQQAAVQRVRQSHREDRGRWTGCGPSREASRATRVSVWPSVRARPETRPG